MFADRRDVGYIDRYIVNLVQPLSASACSGAVFAMPAHDEVAYVVLPLTGREISRLVSCVEYGADLLYPGASHEIYWSFVQGLECSVLCDAIAQQCLTNPAFVDTLNQTLVASGVPLQNGLSDTVLASQNDLVLIDLGEGCDDDDRYGACYTFVDLLHTVCVDLLDLLSLGASQLEYAEALVRNIPIIANYADTALELAEWYLNTVVEAYDAAYNTTSHEELACAVLCVMDGSCQLTLGMVLEGYRNALTVEVSPPPLASGFADLLGWFVGLVGIYSDTVIVGLYHWLVLQVFARGSSINQTTARILTIALSQTSPLTPPESCECSTWVHTFDFVGAGSDPSTTYGQGGWVSRDKPASFGTTYGATYYAGIGWQSSGAGASKGLGISIELPADAQFTSCQMFGSGNLVNPAFYAGNEAKPSFDANFYSYGGADWDDAFSFIGTSEKASFPYLSCGTLAPAGSGSVNTLTKVVFRGIGDDPFAA